MKKLVTCPNRVNPFTDLNIRVFLAGGISNCSDWQKEYWELVPEDLPVTIINPRRVDFDITNPKMSEEQIAWEYQYLNKYCDLVSFWFAPETLCPITLFEYGKALGQRDPVVIGADPNYSRRFDLIYQTSHVDLSIKVVDSIPCLVKEMEQEVIKLITQRNNQFMDTYSS